MTPREGPSRAVRRAQWRLHKLLWRLSRGRLGSRVLGMPVLELVTTGRRSGEPRAVLLTYVPTASGPALAGTNAGADTDPAWLSNLRAAPRAEVRERGVWRSVEARFLQGDEHEEMWRRFTAADEGYARYRSMVSRPIPLVVLEDRADQISRA